MTDSFDEWWCNEARKEAMYSRRHGEFDRAVAYDAVAETFPERCADWDMYIRETFIPAVETRLGY